MRKRLSGFVLVAVRRRPNILAAVLIGFRLGVELVEGSSVRCTGQSYRMSAETLLMLTLD